MNFLTLDTPSEKKFILYSETGKWALANNLNEEIKKELIKPYFKKKFRGTRLVVLNMGRRCNLNCNYCHVGDLKEEDRVMSYKVAKKTIKRVLELDEKNRRVVFHGSEPLMNFDLIKKIVDYSNKKTKTIEFSIQTNGTLLNNKILSYMKKNKINIGISLDGLKIHQDLNRPYKQGESSYEKVIENLKKTREAQGGISVISVVTKYNVDDLSEIARDFTKKGIESVLFSPVSNVGNSDIMPNLKTLTKNMKELFDEYIFNMSSEIKSVKIRNFRDSLRTFFMDKITPNCVKCGGDDLHPLMAVDVEGSIYPCDFFWGQKEHSVGNVFETSLNNSFNSPENLRVKRNLKNLESCFKCEWKTFCGNGCPGSSMRENKKTITKNYYCSYSKNMFEHIAKKIPFLHEKKLIGKILEE